MTRIKRFSKRDWFDGIFNAVLFDTPADIRRRDIRRVQKKRKKSVRAYGNPRKPKATGTCYETAFQALFDGQHDEWTLVHGRPTLTVEPFIEYGHAWIEDPDGVTVFDTESRSYWPVHIYYKYGKIDPKKSTRYDKDEAIRWAMERNHYGPWHGPEAVGSLHRKRRTKRNPTTLRDLINGLRANEKANKVPTTNHMWRFIRDWPKCPDEYKGELFYFLISSRDYRAISAAMQRCKITKDDFENMILQAVIATTPQDFKHVKGFPPADEMAAALMEEGHDWHSGDLKALQKIIVSVSNLKADEIPEPYLTAVDKAADLWLDS